MTFPMLCDKFNITKENRIELLTEMMWDTTGELNPEHKPTVWATFVHLQMLPFFTTGGRTTITFHIRRRSLCLKMSIRHYVMAE